MSLSAKLRAHDVAHGTGGNGLTVLWTCPPVTATPPRPSPKGGSRAQAQKV